MCVPGCLCLLIEPHFGYSNISHHQVRMFAAPNPIFSSYKTWLVVYTYPSEKYMTSSVGIIVPYCSQLIWKVIKFHGSSHHQAETVMFGVKNAMFKVKVPFKSPHPAPWTRGTPGWSRKPAPSPKAIGKWCFNQQQKSGFQGDLELIDLESMIAELTVDFIGEF